MALRDRLLGDPDTLDGPALARGVRRGSESFAVRCVRALGERDEEPAVDFLLPLLGDERASLRRAAAASLGHLGRSRARAALERAWAGERTEEGRLALAVATVRCGAEPDPVAARLDRFERRVAQTWQGPRSPQAAAAVGVLLDRFWECLGDAAAGAEPGRATRPSAAFERATLLASGDGTCGVGPYAGVAGAPDGASDTEKKRAETSGHARMDDAGPVVHEVVPRALLRERRLASLARAAVEGRDERAAIQALAGLRHPDDHVRLSGLLASAGRREEHAMLAGLGMGGDPRAARVLTDALFATDVDPGRGFAQRRLSATALGRLGLRETTPSVLRALENEAHDYEGRPGAGMGVQYPVRTNLLWALGEIGDPAAASVLVRYLGDIHGSAFGGFYLPAMDALAKLGPAVAPTLARIAAAGAEVEAANAVGTLGLMGEDVSAWEGDRRRPVADVARRVRG